MSATKSTSLYLPRLQWFRELLKEINKTESISSYLFKIAAEDLFEKKLISKKVYQVAKEEIELRSKKPRPAVLKDDNKHLKIYIKEPFEPLVAAITEQGESCSSYFWTLLVKNAKLSKTQIAEFKEAYPKVEL